MFKILIPESVNEILYEVTLEPSSNGIDWVSKNREVPEGAVKLFLAKKNKVAVGIPYYENLVSKLITEKQEISHEIKQMIDDYDFHFVNLSCSFLPDRDCRFVWARFGVELNAVNKETGEILKERPIAYDMFPDKVLSVMKCKREARLNSQLKLNFGIVTAELKGGHKK